MLLKEELINFVDIEEFTKQLSFKAKNLEM